METIRRTAQWAILLCALALLIGSLGRTVRADDDKKNTAVTNAANLVAQGH
jgi:hypothetical protein